MTTEAERLQNALREAKSLAEMSVALENASAYVQKHPSDDLEPLLATMHVIEMTLAA